jgi:hypothetical protein
MDILDDSRNKYVPTKYPIRHENICYAINCDNIASVDIVLIAGEKQIAIRVCDFCKSKFE